VKNAVNQLYKKIKSQLGGYQKAEPDSSLPRFADHGRGRYRIHCGEPKPSHPRQKGFVFSGSHYALSFEIFIRDSACGLECETYSISLQIPTKTTIMFHRDPGRAQWPEHPECHIQFEVSDLAVSEAPFLAWRIPIGQVEPLKLLEFLTAKSSQELAP